jgi:hypothetical protein
MAKKRPNKAEREYMSKVANHGCIACEIDGKISPAEIHHIIKQRIEEWDSLTSIF